MRREGKTLNLQVCWKGSNLEGGGRKYECIRGGVDIRRLAQGRFIREHAHVKTCLYHNKLFSLLYGFVFTGHLLAFFGISAYFYREL